MKTYEESLKELKTTLKCLKEIDAHDIRYGLLSYANGIAFVLDVKIDYEKLEFEVK